MYVICGLIDSNTSSTEQVAAPAGSPDEKVYLFKPPPPYPGAGSGSASSASLQPTVDMTNSSSELQSVSSKEQTQSIKMGTSVSRVPPSELLSGSSSRSVSSAVSVVSAEVHNIPNPRENKPESKGSSVSTKSLHGAPVPKTNGLLKEGNGTRKGAVIHNESKPGHLFGKPIDPNILREFQAIPKVKNNANFATALRRENAKRNRCPEVLPYEDNAIRLHPTRHNPLGYVNASPLLVSWFL